MQVGEAPAAGTAPGWYEFHGGWRYWDGEEWTPHMAPPSPAKPLTQAQIAIAIAFGVVIGWAVVWLLAQGAPDTFYWPVKFVVHELPGA